MARANQRLNAPKKRAQGPVVSGRGRSSIAERAGERVSALKAEMITEIAIVTANCRLSRPWIPLMRPMGMKTEESTRAIPTTGPETSDRKVRFRLARIAFAERPGERRSSQGSRERKKKAV